MNRIVFYIGCALIFFTLGCGTDPSVPDAVTQHRVTTSGEEIDFDTQMKLLLATLEMYKIHVGHYPSTGNGLQALVSQPDTLESSGTWMGPYIESEEALTDPWGNPLFYRLEETGVVILKSLGEDGVESADDLDANTMFPHWAKEMEKMANIPRPTIEMP